MTIDAIGCADRGRPDQPSDPRGCHRVDPLREPNPGRDYYVGKLGEGKAKKEAIRALKRRITHAVWRQLQLDRQHHDQDNDWPRWPSTRRGNPTCRSPDTLRANANPCDPAQHHPSTKS